MSYTIILIILTVAVSALAWQNKALYDNFIFSATAVTDRNQYYRFITCGFVHLDWGHLFFNMLALYFFGESVESIFRAVFGETGALLFIGLYLSAIIISEVPSFLKNKENRYYRSLGASGGVAAIVFVSILYYPNGTIFIYFIPLPSILAGLLYLVYSVNMSKAMDGTNHLAHLAGSIYGVAFAIISNPQVIPVFIEQLKHFSLF
jgi:membrane associated rhomboid family serine protease